MDAEQLAQNISELLGTRLGTIIFNHKYKYIQEELLYNTKYLHLKHLSRYIIVTAYLYPNIM